MRHNDATITQALQMHYQGMSVRDIADNLEMVGMEVSHVTVYKWIDRYSKLTAQYLNGIVPMVSDWFRAD